jgi:DNA-binding Lrp family transcriptional regulator
MRGFAMPTAKKIQPKVELDDTDLEMLRVLSSNGRISNADLANELSIAPSTSLMRMRRLIDQGVIRSFAAEINPEAIGLELQALISVTLRAGARSNLASFMKSMQQHPQVVQVFFLGGQEDFMVHVAVANSEEVREFVLEQLSNNPFVANTRTNLVFDHFHKGPIS